MKKTIYFIALLFLVGCVDLSENMYNDSGGDNYYQAKQEYDTTFMNQYTFLRTMYAWNVFYLQEIAADKACLPQKGRDGCDGGIYQRMHWHTWTDQDVIISEAWQELFEAVDFCNQVLNDLSSSRSDILPGNKKKLYIAESRALKAFFYSILVDMLGNVPIVGKISELSPPTKTRTKVFNCAEKEIAEVKDQLLRSTDTGSYGRFTQEAVLALLSRPYPNTEVYTGTSRLDDCIPVSQALLQRGYQLEPARDAPFT